MRVFKNRFEICNILQTTEKNCTFILKREEIQEETPEIVESILSNIQW